tara:strand:+ start:43 stop:612 length:570 start_codon:yes stop_codon:yes gene_type:complete
MKIPILYINLDSRNDRKEEMEKILKGFNYERVTAIKNDDGYIGCCLSHIKCLEIAKSRNYQKVIILEDDFMFKENHNFNNMELPEDYDVFLLSNLIKSCVSINDRFNRIYHCEWTSGHIVNESIYDDLIQNLYEGMWDRSKNGKSRSNNLDIYWMKLMKNYNFISNKTCVGTQRSGYSDIKGENISRFN